MLEALRASVDGLRGGTPGRRFWDAYHQEDRCGGSVVRSVGAAVVGVLCVVAGLLMLVIPGPGVATLLLGLWILSSNFLSVARLLDKFELWLKRSRLARNIRRSWSRSSQLTRALVRLLGLVPCLVLCYVVLT